MSYSPSIGRFLERDPIGSPTLDVLDTAPVVSDAVQRAQRHVAAKFGEEHAGDRWLWQYADGLSTYEFVSSNPVNATDPSGLNRYYVGPGHWGVGVDIWKQDKNGTWVVVGQRQYDFSAPHTWYFFCGLVAIRGEVSAKDGVDDKSDAIKSNREQDQKLLEALEYTVNHPPVYTVAFGFSCREYANVMIRIGMDEK